MTKLELNDNWKYLLLNKKIRNFCIRLIKAYPEHEDMIYFALDDYLRSTDLSFEELPREWTSTRGYKSKAYHDGIFLIELRICEPHFQIIISSDSGLKLPLKKTEFRYDHIFDAIEKVEQLKQEISDLYSREPNFCSITQLSPDDCDIALCTFKNLKNQKVIPEWIEIDTGAE